MRWTPRALDEVDAIAAYIAIDAPAFADVFARRLVAATRHLGQFPLSGRAVPELGQEDLREVIVGGYRVIYRAGPARVTVLTVQHGARRLDP